MGGQLWRKCGAHQQNGRNDDGYPAQSGLADPLL
jgi:hypothetical protein